MRTPFRLLQQLANADRPPLVPSRFRYLLKLLERKSVQMSTSGQPPKKKPRLEGEEETEREEKEEASASTFTSASTTHKIILDVPAVQCVECRLCEESFQGHNELLRHIRRVHKLVPETQYRCLGCGKTGEKVKAIKACARKHGLDPNAQGAAETFTCG